MRRMIRMLSVLLLCLLPLSVGAEDVCTVTDASTAAQVTTGCSYLRVECPLPGETCVTLSVMDQWGTLIYQRDYGLCAGSFRSKDIYLPLDGERCDYTVTLLTGLGDYAFTVTREQPMLTDSAVYASGLTLKELGGGSSRKYAVVLDLDALNQETAAVPMLAGGVQVGEVYFSVLDGKLTVSAALTVQGEINKATVYIATDALTAQTLGSSRFAGIKTRLDRRIDLGDAPYAAVMVQLNVTYDPATLQEGSAGSLTNGEMRESWQLMQLTTANEAVG